MPTTYQWHGSGSARTGTWETASDWTPAGEPGGDDVAEIVLGTVTEDVNQPLLTSQNQVNPGVVVGALTISSRGALVIGDSAGDNRAIMTIDDTHSTFIAGSVTVYAAGSEQSQLRSSGAIELASTGSLQLDGGTLLADNELTLAGPGVVDLLGGFIGGSSLQPSDTLVNTATIAGVGEISAVNYYAAPPATPLSGPINFNGLTTNNYGVIDGSDVSGGTAGLTIAGGIVNNYGTLEATDASGQTGSGGLYIFEGAEVVNRNSGSIASGAGAFIDLDGGRIYNGTISGTLFVDSTGNVLGATGTQSLTLNATTWISGAVTVATTDVINDGHITVENTGRMHTSNYFDNNINATIDVYGVFSTGTLGDISNAGDINADSGGVVLVDTHYLSGAGQVNINGGIVQFNTTGAAHVNFDQPGGRLVLDQGSVQSVNNFYEEGSNLAAGAASINFADIGYSPGETATLTQESGLAVLQLGYYSVFLDGTYTSLTTPITINSGSTPLHLFEGPNGSTSVTG